MELFGSDLELPGEKNDCVSYDPYAVTDAIE